jgi:hypothetical protein
MTTRLWCLCLLAVLLQNGMYQCKTCVPTVSVKADGDDQTIAGNPYYDAISIKVLDDRSIERTGEKWEDCRNFKMKPRDGSTAQPPTTCGEPPSCL